MWMRCYSVAAQGHFCFLLAGALTHLWLTGTTGWFSTATAFCFFGSSMNDRTSCWPRSQVIVSGALVDATYLSYLRYYSGNTSPQRPSNLSSNWPLLLAAATSGVSMFSSFVVQCTKVFHLFIPAHDFVRFCSWPLMVGYDLGQTAVRRCYTTLQTVYILWAPCAYACHLPDTSIEAKFAADLLFHYRRDQYQCLNCFSTDVRICSG